MNFEWSDIQLGDFLELKRGYDLPHKDRKEGDYKVISSSGPSGFHSEGKVKGPGVVTGRYGTIGKVFYSERDFWPLNTTLYVKDFKGNHPEFVYYFLKTLDFLQYSDKAAVPGVNRNHLHTAWVKVPESTKVQEGIAKFLSDLDKKRTLNTQINQTLEQMAQALFKSWFVDFDPVIDNALEAGNPIPEPLAERAAHRQAMWAAGSEKAPARLPAETRRLFPDSFEENEVLGWVPVGWKAGKLSQLAALDTTSINPGKEPGKEFEHYSIPAFDSSQRPSFDAGESIKSGKYKVDAKAILVSKLNPGTQRVWWVSPCDKEAAICSTEFMPFVPKDGESRAFIYFLLKSDLVQNEILNSVTGTTGSRQRAQPKKVAVADVLLPNSEAMRAFSEYVEPMKDKQVKNIEQSVNLAQLRDTLLPKLLSGELQLPEAEAGVEAALEVEPA